MTENSAGRSTLIFLHGGPGFRDYLRPYFAELADTFSCVFFDQLQGSNVTLDSLLNQLRQIARTHPGPKILVGHSWGAVLAVEFATRFPTEVTALVLLNSALFHGDWTEEFHAELERKGLVGAKSADIFLSAAEHAVGVPLLTEIESHFSRETFDAVYRSHLTDYDLREKFRELRLPILHIYGEKDVRFPRHVSERFHAINSRVIPLPLPEAGHMPFLVDRTRKEILAKIRAIFAPT